MFKAVLEADPSTPAIPSIRHLLKILSVEHGLVLDGPNYFDGLVRSLLPDEIWVLGRETVCFFDNCASRIARQPAHYEDLAAVARRNGHTMGLLPFCIAEQWPFVTVNKGAKECENIAEWISRLLMLLIRAGEDKDTIGTLRSQMMAATKESQFSNILRKTDWKILRNMNIQERVPSGRGAAAQPHSPQLAQGRDTSVAKMEAVFGRQLKRIETIAGLERLHQEELGEVLANGRLGRLCRCLSSLEDETRRHAFLTLQGMLRQIEVCGFMPWLSDLLVNLLRRCLATRKRGPCLSWWESLWRP